MQTLLKKKVIVAVIVPALGLPVTPPSFAQNETVGIGTARIAVPDSERLASRDMRAGKLIGSKVENAQGERLGEIHDLIIDVANEKVPYAVLSFGGALGFGDKLFTFPLRVFGPGHERPGHERPGHERPGRARQSGDPDVLVLNVDRDRLKEAPGFEKNRWPDWSNDRYRKEVDRYFGTNAVAGSVSGERMMRASRLIGKDIDDSNGRNAGKIEDIVINTGTQQIRYVVIDFDKAWNPDDKLVALPLRVFNFPARSGRDLVLSVERDRINTARGFDAHHWPDLNAPGYQQEMDEYLSSFQPDRTHREQRTNMDRGTTSGASR